MRNLTPNEIERIVDIVKDHQDPDGDNYNGLRSDLATVQLDQPKIDLYKVEELVKSYCTTHSAAESWRKAIGYTLNDLNP